MWELSANEPWARGLCQLKGVCYCGCVLVLWTLLLAVACSVFSSVESVALETELTVAVAISAMIVQPAYSTCGHGQTKAWPCPAPVWFVGFRQMPPRWQHPPGPMGSAQLPPCTGEHRALPRQVGAWTQAPARAVLGHRFPGTPLCLGSSARGSQTSLYPVLCAPATPLLLSPPWSVCHGPDPAGRVLWLLALFPAHLGSRL